MAAGHPCSASPKLVSSWFFFSTSSPSSLTSYHSTSRKEQRYLSSVVSQKSHLFVSTQWAPTAQLLFSWKVHELEAVVTSGLEGHPHPRGEGPFVAPPPPDGQGAAGREVLALSLLPHVWAAGRRTSRLGKKIQCELFLSINQCFFFFPSCLASLHLFVFPSPSEQGELVFLNLAEETN